MTKPKPGLSAQVIEKFCELCNLTYEYWLNDRELFDNNPRSSELMQSFAAEELDRLRTISHEYSLLQIVKLHDKAIMNGDITLGIDYVLKYGNWSDPVRCRLDKLAKELNNFASILRNARNKILSHNDLKTILADAVLGEFPKDADEEYFLTLQKFVNTVHEEVIGGPYPFCTVAINDVAAFLETIRLK